MYLILIISKQYLLKVIVQRPQARLFRDIMNHLTHKLDDFQPHDQAGFWAGCNIVPQITYIHCSRLYSSPRYRSQERTDLYALFMDYGKAYDSVLGCRFFIYFKFITGISKCWGGWMKRYHVRSSPGSHPSTDPIAERHEYSETVYGLTCIPKNRDMFKFY